jgi:hypothetical protein
MNPVETIGANGGLPGDLVAQEQSLAIAAKEMLDGIATHDQKEVFLGQLSSYQELLGGYVLERLVERTGGDTDTSNIHLETDMREAMIVDLLASKRRIVGSAAFEHSQSSAVERTRHYLEQSKRRRWLGKAAIAGSVGTASYATAKGVEWISGAEAAVAGGITLWLFKQGTRIKHWGRMLTSASSRKAREGAYSGIDRHDLSMMNQIIREVADIPDSKLREREIHNRLADEVHIKQTRAQLSSELIDEYIIRDDGTVDDQMVARATGLLVQSLAQVYELDINNPPRKTSTRIKHFVSQKLGRRWNRAEQPSDAV